jgi:Enoyl-CoA hydratase/isomerase
MPRRGSGTTTTPFVLVVTGAGEAFCAGWGLEDAAEWPTPDWDEFRRDLHTVPGVCGYSRRADVFKPVIAAVNGWAVAAGLENALLADIRIASENAIFGALERRWNIVAGDGMTVRLPLVVGWARRADHHRTGRGRRGGAPNWPRQRGRAGGPGAGSGARARQRDRRPAPGRDPDRQGDPPPQTSGTRSSSSFATRPRQRCRRSCAATHTRRCPCLQGEAGAGMAAPRPLSSTYLTLSVPCMPASRWPGTEQ